VSLTAQQPEVNIARVAIEALAGVLGGTQSLHTDSYDEALALPTEKAARIALRTQQVVAHETGVAEVADPLGGSYFVEWMTDEMERRAEAVFEHLDRLGEGSMLEGVYRAVEEGWFQREIAEAAADFERRVNDGRRVVVGVNRHTEGDEGGTDILYIGGQVEEVQRKRLAEVKRSRDDGTVAVALQQVRRDAAVTDRNLMPAVLGAVGAYATVGEIVGALQDVFGTWDEQPVV
jgi:methylmalonyl-CoA mutase N-terminal domain/subunit